MCFSFINTVGAIDSDYRGEIMVGLHNYSNETQFVAPSERVARLVLLKYNPINLLK